MLRWDFNEKIGSMWIVKKDGTPYELDLYQGNAYLIMIHNYEQNVDKYYELYSFFADKQHMDNCLGLHKGYENIFGDEIKAMRLSPDTRYLMDIVKSFTRAYKDKDFTLTIGKV